MRKNINICDNSFLKNGRYYNIVKSINYVVLFK